MDQRGVTMHGMYFSELNRYVSENLDLGAWDEILNAIGQRHKIFIASEVYPDEIFFEIFKRVSEQTCEPLDTVMEKFGTFMAADMMRIYEPLIDPEWKTLELLENIEEPIKKYAELCGIEHGDAVPNFTCERLSDGELLLVYDDSRKMCRFLQGLVKGFAQNNREFVIVHEIACMHNGNPDCRISVKRLR